MAWFKKKDKVIDLTTYKKDIEKAETSGRIASLTPSSNQNPQDSNSGGMFGFFGSMANAGASNSNSSGQSQETETSFGTQTSSAYNPDEKRRKLAKHLQGITTKLEEISNSIYKIEQRLELVEKKLNLSRY